MDDDNKKENSPNLNSSHTLKFLVTDSHGETLIGANISLKDSNRIGTTGSSQQNG